MSFLNIKNIQNFSLYFEFTIKFYVFRFLSMTSNILTISIWVNRKFATSECSFLTRMNCRKNNWRFVTSSVLYRLMRTFFIMIFLNREVHRHLFLNSQISIIIRLSRSEKRPYHWKNKFLLFSDLKNYFFLVSGHIW